MIRSALMISAVAGMVAASWGAALAQGIHTQFFIADVQRITPQCRALPDAPIVGRVAGIMGGVPTRGVSFEGCFYDAAECLAWRDFVSARIEGRLTQNVCETRR